MSGKFSGKWCVSAIGVRVLLKALVLLRVIACGFCFEQDANSRVMYSRVMRQVKGFSTGEFCIHVHCTGWPR